MDCSPPDSSVHGIFQVRILEWIAISSSRGSSWPRDWIHVSCIGREFLYHWATWEALSTWQATLDLESAFFSMFANMDHQKQLAFSWQGQWYIFTVLPQGYITSAALCHHLVHRNLDHLLLKKLTTFQLPIRSIRMDAGPGTLSSCLLLFSCSVISNSLRPHGLQHTCLPCPSLFLRVSQTHVHWVDDVI